jgi:hypothetical protein
MSSPGYVQFLIPFRSVAQHGGAVSREEVVQADVLAEGNVAEVLHARVL